jgi:hypothetical protein
MGVSVPPEDLLNPTQTTTVAGKPPVVNDNRTTCWTSSGVAPAAKALRTLERIAPSDREPRRCQPADDTRPVVFDNR